MSGLGNKEIMAKNIKRYMESHGVDRNKICADLGIKYTTFSDWINAKTYPRIDKIELIANYFGVSKSDLVEDLNTPSPAGYYADPEVAEMANKLKNNPDMRILFDAAEDMSKDDIEFVVDMIDKLKKREGK